MLKTVVGQMGLVLRGSIGAKTARIVSVRQSHGGPVESDEAFDSRYEAYFLRNDIDGWEVRKGMNGKYFKPPKKIRSKNIFSSRHHRNGFSSRSKNHQCCFKSLP